MTREFTESVCTTGNPRGGIYGREIYERKTEAGKLRRRQEEASRTREGKTNIPGEVGVTALISRVIE